MRENVDQNNAEYGQFLRSVSDNSYFEISRPYVKNHDDESLKIYELHGFSKPCNSHTIARSKLLGSLLLERVINYVKKALLCQVTILDHFYWTDSIISLLRIKRFDKDYKPFV